jgi:hypothetical protein
VVGNVAAADVVSATAVGTTAAAATALRNSPGWEKRRRSNREEQGK